MFTHPYTGIPVNVRRQKKFIIVLNLNWVWDKVRKWIYLSHPQSLRKWTQQIIYTIYYLLLHMLHRIVLKTRLRHCLIEYLGIYSSRNNYYSLFSSSAYLFCFTFHVFSHLFALVSVNYKNLCGWVEHFTPYLDALF